jgi:hypothetical protein
LTDVEEPTVAQARRTTLVVAGVLALAGGWQLYHGRATAAGALGVTVALLLVCSAVPSAAVRLHIWWMTLAGALGYVNSRIILSALFVLIMTPVGLIVRMAGHDPLERRRAREQSYWRPRAGTRRRREDYERAF